jgi:hypothetical protein
MPRPIVVVEDVECLKETDKALLCVINGKERWVPKSVVDDDSEVYGVGDEGKLVIHEWWAEKEEIES